MFERLFIVNSSDEELQRRGILTMIVALGMAVLAIAFLLAFGLQAGAGQTLPLLLVAIAIYIAIAVVAQRGYVEQASYSLVLFTTLIILAYLLRSPDAELIYFLNIAIMLAGTVLTARQIWLVFGLSMAGIGAAFVRTEQPGLDDYLSPILLLSIITFLAYLTARSAENALGAARLARSESAEANTALHQANTTLEAQVHERTDVLNQALTAQRSLTDDLQASLSTQQNLNELVNQLSAPFIPVRRDTLVVPLVGQLNDQRIKILLESILTEVERTRVRTVILDITGVVVVDNAGAQAITTIAAATALLGATIVLVGIRPEVAQTLVSLGSDLSHIQTAATLQDALAASPTANA